MALACACALVPKRRYALNLVPLGGGIGLGVVAVLTSGSTGPVPWLGVALIVGAAISLVRVPDEWVHLPRRRNVVAFVAVIACLAVASFALLRHQIDVRALSPSNGDRAVEWRTGVDQFKSSPVIGVGPDRILQFDAVDGTYAHFVHNEYLQIAADTGIVGLAILLMSVVSMARVVRRVDAATSCAVAALVCCAVAGAFDFDFHLPLVGLIVGWTAGAATRRKTCD